VESIRKNAEKENVKAGVFTLIGALKQATVGCYRNGEYKRIELKGPLEIASCMGNIAIDEEGGIVVHSHIVVSNEDGEAFGGHLMKGSFVGATAELVVIEVLGINLRRTLDQRTGLELLDLP